MGRGFLSGIFWGSIVGVVALFVSSQVLDRQQLSFPQPEASAVEVPGGSEFDQAREETDPVLPEPESRPEADAVTGVQLPEDAIDTPPAMDTAALEVPVPQPEQDVPAGLGEAPAEVPVGDEPSATDEALQSTPTQPLGAPDSPGAAPAADAGDPVAPATDTASEATPDVAVTPEDTPANAETEVAALPQTEAETTQPETSNAPAVSSQAEAPQGLSPPDAASDQALPPSAGAGSVSDAPEAPRLPQIAQEPSLPEPGDSPQVADTPTAPTAPAADTGQGASAIRVDGGESLLKPVEELGDQATAVQTDRLPQAGTPDNSDSLPTIRRFGDNTEEPGGDPEIATNETDPEAEGPQADASGAALQLYRSTFENGEGRPLLALVLVHDAPGMLSDEVLAGLPEHVGFGIDAGRPDAAELAKAYRAAGREVAMIPSLPAGAEPQDVEQALQINFDTIPEAVALMDVSGSSFQSDRAAVEQVVDVVSDTGHGLITFPRGLNTAHQQAQRAGVATGLIFRNLDGSGQNQEQIRRTLDRAAFRARQDEAVILVGTTDDVTLAAIIEWALGNRATSVTIAPISAALSGG